jgi:hypothetical protein
MLCSRICLSTFAPIGVLRAPPVWREAFCCWSSDPSALTTLSCACAAPRGRVVSTCRPGIRVGRAPVRWCGLNRAGRGTLNEGRGWHDRRRRGRHRDATAGADRSDSEDATAGAGSIGRQQARAEAAERTAQQARTQRLSRERATESPIEPREEHRAPNREPARAAGRYGIESPVERSSDGPQGTREPEPTQPQGLQSRQRHNRGQS